MILHALAGRARRFDELWRRAGWSLWPPRCLVCAEPGRDGRDLCGACCAAWPRAGSACVRCAMPLPVVTPADDGDSSRAGASAVGSRILSMEPATERTDGADQPRLARTASVGGDGSLSDRRVDPHAGAGSDWFARHPAPLCGACLRRPPPLDSVRAACLYRSPVDRLLPRFKFHRDLAAGRLLATMMGEAFAPLLDDMAWRSDGATTATARVDPDSAASSDAPLPRPDSANTAPQRPNDAGIAARTRARALALAHDGTVAPPVLVPIPLHRGRLRERGYDQALELARPLARCLDLPLQAQALVRVRDTSAQSRLDASQRRRNLRDAFAWNRDIAMPAHVVLIDDVMTTGATLHSAARALRRAGAVRVDAWVCARVL
jgi:ComF family protein